MDEKTKAQLAGTITSSGGREHAVSRPNEAEELASRLRNPLERVVKSLSDRLQAGLAFLGSLL